MNTLKVSATTIHTIDYVKKVECHKLWSLGEPCDTDEDFYYYDLSELYLCGYDQEQALNVHKNILSKLNISFEVE